jgi:hypothetical protein
MPVSVSPARARTVRRRYFGFIGIYSYTNGTAEIIINAATNSETGRQTS